MDQPLKTGTVVPACFYFKKCINALKEQKVPELWFVKWDGGAGCCRGLCVSWLVFGVSRGHAWGYVCKWEVLAGLPRCGGAFASAQQIERKHDDILRLLALLMFLLFSVWFNIAVPHSRLSY